MRELLLDGETLWIGTQLGLARYNLDTGAVTIIDALAGKDVQALILDSMHRLWAGTRGNGVFVQMGSEIWTQHINVAGDENSISANDIAALPPSRRSGVWAAVDRHGLNFWGRRTLARLQRAHRVAQQTPCTRSSSIQWTVRSGSAAKAASPAMMGVLGRR
ncbi:MAG: hypothetical protein R2856_11055 [Caldilineaceae bacterium]